MPRAARRKIAFFARFMAFFNEKLLPDACIHHEHTPLIVHIGHALMPTPNRTSDHGRVHANAKIRLQATLLFWSLEARLRFPLRASRAQAMARPICSPHACNPNAEHGPTRHPVLHPPHPSTHEQPTRASSASSEPSKPAIEAGRAGIAPASATGVRHLDCVRRVTARTCNSVNNGQNIRT